MRYGSVCSGIEAASVAWNPLGWEAQFLSEIEPFPCSVLNSHYPTVPNLGDMTKFKEWPDATINVLVGGTPCQPFSVAGLRKGLADPRGNLMLTYLAIADRYRPEWVVWENVPGVLSSNGGRDFASLLRGLAELGYGFAYRILDAQFCGVPQRRRRVFVVGCLGSWQRAAAVLFERHSLQGHNPPSRKAGEEVAGTIAKYSFSGGAGGRPEGAAGNHFLAIGIDEECNATVDGFGPLLRGGQGGTRQEVAYHTTGSGYWAEGGGTLRAREQDSHENVVCMSTGQAGAEIGIGIGTTLNCNHEAPIVCQYGKIAGSLTARYDSSSCADRGQNIIAVGVDGGNVGYALRANASHSGDKGDGGMNTTAVIYRTNAAGQIMNQGDRSATLNTFTDPTAQFLQSAMQVRRLTPMECERLQGFPDGYTNIVVKGKPAADGPRYKALGNSMAVPVMHWIGQRIQAVHAL